MVKQIPVGAWDKLAATIACESSFAHQWEQTPKTHKDLRFWHRHRHGSVGRWRLCPAPAAGEPRLRQRCF
ncbi:hypothetical protein [Kamptonema formosum]|uniref:hypothetical protein n=1 Tax=Kamptonema formosum TaxID=331992 RepID=UPI0003476517|nr:hypothetical protein [Oscillatoria sp. PCC 10802]